MARPRARALSTSSALARWISREDAVVFEARREALEEGQNCHVAGLGQRRERGRGARDGRAGGFGGGFRNHHQLAELSQRHEAVAVV